MPIKIYLSQTDYTYSIIISPITKFMAYFKICIWTALNIHFRKILRIKIIRRSNIHIIYSSALIKHISISSLTNIKCRTIKINLSSVINTSKVRIRRNFIIILICIFIKNSGPTKCFSGNAFVYYSFSANRIYFPT